MIWQTLGIPATTDRDSIRRAYAKKLRVTNPEDDPQGFMVLREAYEAALAHLDWPEWDEDEETSPPERDVGLGAIAEPDEPNTSPPAGEVGLGEAEPGEGEASLLAGEGPEPPPPANRLEQLELQATRRAEAADLAARQQALVAALKSPWPSAPEALEAHLATILAAPALDAIGARNDIEDWLAATIANHFPASDPLVARAIAAFGWGSDAASATPAAGAVVHRREVLDFVAVTSLPYRPLNLGWQALTRPALSPARMRLKALMPGLAAEVATLFETARHSLPGIEQWFDVAAGTWWEQHLARERIGPGHLALIPFAAVLIALAGSALGLPVALTAVLALSSLAAPWLGVRLIKQPQRDWAESPWARPAWQLEGWPGAMIALPLLALFGPDSDLGLVGIAVAALISLVWTTIAVPLPRSLTGWQRVGGIAQATWPFGIIGLMGLTLMTPTRALVWIVVTLTLVLCWWRAHDTLAVASWRGLGRAQRFGLPLVTGIAVVLLQAVGAFASAAPPAEAVYRIWIGISAAMILLFIANRLADTGRIKLVLAIGWLAVLIAIGSGIARAPPDRARPAPVEAPGGPDVNARFDPGFTPATCNADLRRAENPGAPLPPDVCGSPGDWIRAADYPARVAARGAEGVTGFELTIDDKGRVSDCIITDSSSIGLLDDATCTLITARARFHPARDRTGAAVEGTYTSRVRWELPGN